MGTTMVRATGCSQAPDLRGFVVSSPWLDRHETSEHELSLALALALLIEWELDCVRYVACTMFYLSAGCQDVSRTMGLDA